jgi:cytochrome c oxidase subunit 4
MSHSVTHDETHSLDETHAPSLDAQDEHGGGHGASDRQYIVIALILALITAAEVSISYIDIGAAFLPALLIMMAVKFFIVVSYFMHLKFDNRIFSYMFYIGLGLALFVYIGALTTFHFWTK